MVLDILRKGEEESRVILPGETLNYNSFDAVPKALTLLHAIWLLVGPALVVLQYVLAKCSQLLPIFCAEVKTVMMQDCVQAVCMWMCGTDLSLAIDVSDGCQMLCASRGGVIKLGILVGMCLNRSTVGQTFPQRSVLCANSSGMRLGVHGFLEF